MLSFLKSHWFLISIIVASAVGYLYPALGTIFQAYDIFSIGVFLAFLTTGLSIETHTILRNIQGIKAPVVAVISSLILYPVLAWLLATMVLPHEFVIGICIISTGPVTVSSGTIMTALARGNVPLSILICLLTSFLAIFTIPIMLSLLLGVGEHVDLPVLQMLVGLILKVLFPIAIGQAIRPTIKPLIKKANRHLSIFQSAIIILIIFNAISQSAEHIAQTGSEMFEVTVFVVFLHFLMLFTNYGLSHLLKLDQPSMTAFTIHTSQKTLTVTYIIWTGYFASDFPMAFVPAIICQLTQMIVGTFVTEYFRKRSEL